MTPADLDPDFTDLLERDAVLAAPSATAEEDPPPTIWLATLARLILADPHRAEDRPRRVIEALIGEIDWAMSGQLNAILHAPDFQALEASWRGVWMLARAANEEAGVKVKVLNIGKRDLVRALRKFRGNAWDQSPIFRRLYEEEYGQLGGEPFGVLVGDYTFDHQPDDVALLTDMAKIAAAAHTPFIASAEPSLLQMDNWSEAGNPRDIGRIFTTPEYIAWNAMRQQEDMRYVGLCMPRYLARLPYGAATDPVDEFHFEEETQGPDLSRLLWGNPAYAFASNVAHAFVTYGWCVRIRGVDRGGVVEGLPVLRHATADGDVDRKTVTEICLTEHRDAELAACGLIPLVHRKNTDVAAFISAQSVQKPRDYADPDATMNAKLSARLPYMFACCRFSHYLKCMVRDKIGSTMAQGDLAAWLTGWLDGYVDGSPETSSEDYKATHPLSGAKVEIRDREDMPGMYDARFFLQPHYQLEGLSVAMRLTSRMPGR